MNAQKESVSVRYRERPGAKRTEHKKRTRKGCWNCSRRRSKYDEAKPVYTSCERRDDMYQWRMLRSFPEANINVLECSWLGKARHKNMVLLNYIFISRPVAKPSLIPSTTRASHQRTHTNTHLTQQEKKRKEYSTSSITLLPLAPLPSWLPPSRGP